MHAFNMTMRGYLSLSLLMSIISGQDLVIIRTKLLLLGALKTAKAMDIKNYRKFL